LLIGVEAATARGTSAVFSYLAIYALLAIGSFAVVTLMGGSGDQNHQLEVYHGLGARQPWLAGAFTVLLLAQAGVPLTAGFVAKFGVIAAAADAGSWWLASVAMLATAIAAFAYLRVVVAMYLNDSVSDETITVDRTTCWVISVVVALVMLIGLMPSILLDVARQAVPVLVGG
jgi:NADH-quinone oxidoreductase subunit N